MITTQFCDDTFQVPPSNSNRFVKYSPMTLKDYIHSLFPFPNKQAKTYQKHYLMPKQLFSHLCLDSVIKA